MPRVLKIDSMTNRPICKNAGSGGFLGTSVNIMKCHNKARVGITGQCFKCKFWGQPAKWIGCAPNSGYKCGQQHKN